MAPTDYDLLRAFKKAKPDAEFPGGANHDSLEMLNERCSNGSLTQGEIDAGWLLCLREDKGEEIKRYGLSLIQLISDVYASRTWEDIRFTAEYAGGLTIANTTSDFQEAVSIYQYGKTKVLWVRNTATDQEVSDYDTSADQSWP